MSLSTTIIGWSAPKLEIEGQRPEIDDARPSNCPRCGAPSRGPDGKLSLIGHGCLERRVRGLFGILSLVVYVRRFLCKECGATCTVLPDWMLPEHRYGAEVVLEALWRHYILGEATAKVAMRFACSTCSASWTTLARWGQRLLFCAGLWGFHGTLRGVSGVAADRTEIIQRLEWLLHEGCGHVPRTDDDASIATIHQTARRLLRGKVYDRRGVRLAMHSRPGSRARRIPGGFCPAGPTANASGAPGADRTTSGAPSTGEGSTRFSEVSHDRSTA